MLIAFDISGYQITYDQPLAKGNQGSGSESRTITLRTTPSPSVGTLVHVEFGLTQTTRGKRARWVGDCLDIRLGADILFDHGEESGVTVLELINQDLHGQGRVTSPSIVVYPDELCIPVVPHVGYLQSGLLVLGLAMIMSGFALAAYAPLEPMLLRIPCRATVDSEASQVSRLVRVRLQSHRLEEKFLASKCIR